MNKVKAIFISHEHTDHIKAIPVLAEKYNMDVYITKSTLQKAAVKLKKQLVKDFAAYRPVMIGGLTVTAFPKFHDAADPHSFIISFNSIHVGVFTDIGASCEHVIKHFSQCHAAFLETNYDESLLENGRYPLHLKNRIRGGNGHLSNTQALEIFKKYKPAFMTHLLLSHLSRDNNRPELVKQLFDEHAGGIEIIVASRYEQTAVYTIQQPGINGIKTKTPSSPVRMRQLKLF